MRMSPIIAALLALATPSWAQVTIDLRALEPLRLPGQPAPAPPRPQVRPAPPPQTVIATPRPSPVMTSDPIPAASAPAAPTEQSVGLPLVAPPAAAPPPAPTTPVATGPIETRVTFDAAATELSAANLDTVKRFAAAAPALDGVVFNILAYAAGKSDDPSIARRLSLSRALAVRTALMAEGVASSRILVRALGSQGGGGPADRVDIALLGVNAPGSR